MPVALTSLLLHVGADTRDAESGLGRINDHVGRMGGLVGGLAATFTGGMAVVGGAVLGAVGTVRSFIDAANESTRQSTQLNAVLASTKGVAGLSRDAIDKLTDRLSFMSGIDDEVVTSAESMLLTFTNIGKDVFPHAAEAVLNLSEKFGSVQAASIQVGKALNDPVRGLTALMRVGVSFNETEKEQIKNFVATGQVAKAQGVILKELDIQFGGLAKSMGQTLPGAMGVFKTQLGNVKEAIGLAISEPLRQLLVDRINPLIHTLANDLPRILDNVGTKFHQIALTVQQMLVVFKPLGQIVTQIRDTFKPLTDYVLPGFLQQFKGISVTLPDVTSALNDLVQGALQGFADIWVSIGPALAETAPTIFNMADGFKQMAEALAPLLGLLDPVMKLFMDFLPVLAPLIPTFFSIADQIEHGLVRNLAIVTPAITHLVSVFEEGLAPILKDMVPVIAQVAGVLGDVLTTVLDTLGPLIATVANALADQLGPILKQLAPILHPVIEAIGTWITQIAQDLMPLITALGQLLMKILPPVLEFLGGRIQWLLEIFKAVWPLIYTVVDVALTNIRNVIKIVTDLISGNWSQLGKDLQKFTTDMLGGLWRIISTGFTSFVNLIKTFISPILDAILKPFHMTQDSLGAIWKGIGNLIVDSVNKFAIGSFNGFISNIAKAVDWVADKLHIGKPLIDAEKGILGNIPRFARGGVSSGGLALVGEEGPELAALPAGTRIFSNSQSFGIGTGDDDPGTMDGSGNILGDLFNQIGDWFTKGAGWVAQQALKAFNIGSGFSVAPFGDVGKYLVDSMKSFIDKTLNDFGGGDISGALKSPGAHWWLAHITQGFHPKSNPAHGGIDFGIGFHTPLAALLGGSVYRAGYYPWGGELDLNTNLPGYGHGLENYTHLDWINPAFMHAGAFVPSGAVVGLSGGENPGYPGGLHPAQRRFSSGPHFHYNWFVSRPWAHDDLNPTPFINSLRGGPRKGFAEGGWITEPVAGIGMNTGTQYTFGERESELVVPGSKMRGGNGTTIHVHAGASRSDQELAQKIAAEFYWQQVVRGNN